MGSFKTGLGWATKVDNFGLVDVGGFSEVLEELFVDLVLAVLHVTELFHDLCEDVFVCEDASLGYFEFLGMAQTCLLHFFDSSKDCINLKSESPSGGLLVISFKHVYTFSS